MATTGRKTTAKSRSTAAKKAAATRKRNEAAKAATKTVAEAQAEGARKITDLGNGQIEVDGVVYSTIPANPPTFTPPYLSPGVQLQQAPVDPRLRPESEAEVPSKRKPKKFIRNLRYSNLRIRFEAQDDKRQATNLKRRGERGDLTSLREEWAEDPILFANLQAGIIEIITEAEARKIIDNQYHNATQELHPAMAVIQGDQGQHLDHVEIYDPNLQDIVAAPLTQVDGEGTEQIAFDRAGNIARPQVVQGQPGIPDPYTGVAQARLPGQSPIQVAAPGGALAPTQGAEYSNFSTPAEIEQQIAALQDRLARNPSASGPGAGVAGMQVVVEPVVRG